MSRIGRQPIPLPAGVTVSIAPDSVRVNGPTANSPSGSSAKSSTQEGEQLLVTRPTDRGEHRALHGLTRSLVANMVLGVTNGYEKRLEIQGVGYRAQLKGKDIELAVGYSHSIPIEAPAGIEFEVPQPTRIVVKGISKQLVGETAAIIRKQRPPSPTRARGSATRASTSPARWASGHDRQDQGEPPAVPAQARAGEGLGHRRAPPDLGVPLQPRHLRPARGRRLRAHAGGRQLVRARAQGAVGWPSAARPTRAGALLAQRAKAAGVSRAVFDRGGYRYHGHVAAFADAIREAGLEV